MSGTDHYRRWSDRDSVEDFAHKTATDFFRSETRFLDDIAREVGSVLDVGCAAGRFIELLHRYSSVANYLGIDLSAASVERGRADYPDAEFVLGNALDVEPGRTFDLVNATGVCQHEPRFEDLIGRMVGWSRRYVLFDVKLAAIEQHLVDLERAYCGREHRLYYILLALPRLLDFLSTIPDIARIRVFGYATPLNNRTILPPDVGTVYSAGVFLEKGRSGDDAPEAEIDIPAEAWPAAAGPGRSQS